MNRFSPENVCINNNLQMFHQFYRSYHYYLLSKQFHIIFLSNKNVPKTYIIKVFGVTLDLKMSFNLMVKVISDMRIEHQKKIYLLKTNCRSKIKIEFSANKSKKNRIF